jgi:superfamily I DNA/RNA helicase
VINRHPGTCRNPRCAAPSRRVEAQEGVVVKRADRWLAFHNECVAVLEGDPMDEFRGFDPSDLQLAICDAWENGYDHLVINAVAGSGKTKTILWLIAKTWDAGRRGLGRDPRVLICCFNKTIQIELAGRVHPGTAMASTLNSIGHRAVCGYLKREGLEPTFDNDKIYQVVRTLFPQDETELRALKDERGDYEVLWGEAAPEDLDEYEVRERIQLAYDRNDSMRKALIELANLRRQTLSDDDHWIAETYSVELPWFGGGGRMNSVEAELFGDATVEEACRAILSKAVAAVLGEMESLARTTGLIDYGDQVWLPHVLNLHPKPYDAIFVDESQDLNEAQFQFLLKLAGRSGRMAFVGDPKQAIYEFRGAGVGMIERIRRGLAEGYLEGRSPRYVQELPLNYCYRCPRKVIEHVHRRGHVTHIQAAPGAIEGEVFSVRDGKVWESDDWQDILGGDALILCRTNAPLVTGYFKLLKQRVPAAIRGRTEGGIHKQVLGLINASGGKGGLPGLVERARARCQKKIEILWRARRQGKAIMQRDLFEVLLTLATESDSVHGLRRLVDQVFKDDKDMEGIVLSTVHKAKGLEEGTVVVLRPDLLPLNFFSMTESQIEQEKNLEYVCYTRAQERLVFARPEGAGARIKSLEDIFPGIDLRGKVKK